MGKPREPIDLIIAKGKKHLTKDEIEKRKSEELFVPFNEILVPTYLNATQKKEFNSIACKLKKIGIYTELDIDLLARYVISKSLYLSYTSALVKEIKLEHFENLGKLQKLQDSAFKQCQACGNSLGLSITSRCKLIIPKDEDDEDDEL